MFADSAENLRLKIKLPSPHENKEEPLKIVIRKPELAFPAYPAVPLVVSMQRFPDVQPQPYFQKALGLSSQDQLMQWSEKQLACLKLELEDMRNTLRLFASGINQQSEAIDSFKMRQQEQQQQQLQQQQLLGQPKPYQYGAYGKHGGAGLDDDLEAALADADGSGRGAQRLGGGLDKSKSKGSSSKQQQQLAQQQYQQQQANLLKKRQRSKGGASSSSSKQRKKSSSSSWRSGSDLGDDDSDVDDDPDVAPPPPPSSASRAHKEKHQFWIDMEPYFALFTQDDLQFISTKTVAPEPDIPALGRHYRDVWNEIDQQQSSRDLDPSGLAAAGDDVDDELLGGAASGMVAQGEMTQRMLAAFIEDNVVTPGPSTLPGAASVVPGPGPPPASSAEPSPVSTPAASPPAATDAAGELGGSTAQYAPGLVDPNNSNSAGLAVPIDVPPTFDYSRPWAVSLEMRLRQELHAIGLLDEHDMSQREDDELCAEMRRLYQELQQKVDEINAMRTTVAAAVQAALPEHIEQANKQREYASLELQLSRALSKKKKRTSLRNHD